MGKKSKLYRRELAVLDTDLKIIAKSLPIFPKFTKDSNGNILELVQETRALRGDIILRDKESLRKSGVVFNDSEIDSKKVYGLKITCLNDPLKLLQKWVSMPGMTKEKLEHNINIYKEDYKLYSAWRIKNNLKSVSTHNNEKESENTVS